MRQIIMGQTLLLLTEPLRRPLRTSSKSENRLCIISHSSMGVNVAPSLRGTERGGVDA